MDDFHNFLIAVLIAVLAFPPIIETYANFILTIVCIDYQRKYILNFMNKINFDFENNKIDYKWNAANLFYFLFFAIYFSFSVVALGDKDGDTLFDFKDNYESSREKRNLNNVKISVYNRTDNNSSSERKAKGVASTDDKIIDLKEKIDELNSDKKSLIKEKRILSRRIDELINDKDSLTKEKDDLENEIRQLTRKIDSLSKKEKNNLEKKNAKINSLNNEKKKFRKKN